MTSHAVIDFTRDMTPFHRAAGELIRLARQAPAGLQHLHLLQQAQAGKSLIEWDERIDGERLVLVAHPCGAMVDLIIKLRTAADAQRNSNDPI